MRRNIWAFGDRSLAGHYGRVMSAGELKIEDSDIRSLYGAGDLRIKDSHINRVQSAGEVRAKDSTFENFKGLGRVYLEGMCKADIFAAIGELKAEYLDCRILRNFTKNKRVIVGGISDVLEWEGDLKATTFESQYSFKLSCSYEFINIISEALLISEDELACENLYSFGPLRAETVNAENIFILPRQDSRVQSVYGSNISILRTFKGDKVFKEIPKSIKSKAYKEEDGMISITSIEGDSIALETTKAEHVSGLEVKIGDLCIIERAEYRDHIQISEKAIVNEVVKL